MIVLENGVLQGMKSVGETGSPIAGHFAHFPSLVRTVGIASDVEA
jgi:hypothetical protein